MGTNDEKEKMKGNKGEWSEVYIFLKLLVDGRIYAADKNLRRIPDTYLDIIRILREEHPNEVYDYLPGNTVSITKNDTLVGPNLPKAEYNQIKDEIWNYMKQSSGGSIVIPDAEKFLSKIHITKLKSPAFSKSKIFGGTEDITMEVSDYRSGMETVLSFSCKSDLTAASTLFNASGDNTNFVFEVVGPIDDNVMDEFNSLTNEKGHILIGKRIQYLKDLGCDLIFERPFKKYAERNLILSGGKEMPLLVGALLKHYYWDNEGNASGSSVMDGISYLISHDIAEYHVSNVADLYKRKIGVLLFDMFTGMRLSKDWDGKASVNGGYIVVKGDGDVVAFHSILAEQFKEFLIHSLAFESPSASRHHYMSIYKVDGKYKLNLNMQIRFKKLKQS